MAVSRISSLSITRIEMFLTCCSCPGQEKIFTEALRPVSQQQELNITRQHSRLYVPHRIRRRVPTPKFSITGFMKMDVIPPTFNLWVLRKRKNMTNLTISNSPFQASSMNIRLTEKPGQGTHRRYPQGGNLRHHYTCVNEMWKLSHVIMSYFFTHQLNL